jgi:hypothetical protein
MEQVQGGNEVVEVNFGSAGSLSIQAVQHIYNEITGRSEQLERNYRVNHHVTFEDAQQLHTKVRQICEQYQIVSNNCAVTIYHLDDQKQVFSSFDRFSLYDKSSLCPIISLCIEFNFLIILPLTSKPQSLKIEVNLYSRAALVQRSKRESSIHADFFLHMLDSRTGSLEITYVDYMMARNFESAIDSWFKGLPSKPTKKWLKFAKRSSEHYSVIFRFVGILFYLISAYKYFFPLVEKGGNVSLLYLAGTITFGGAILIGIIFSNIGGGIANAIQKIRALSYINLTRGDEIAFKELQEENTRGGVKIVLNTLVAVCVKFFGVWLATRIGT